MEAILIHPKTKEQASAIKAFAKALKIDFEAAKVEGAYDEKLVAKVLQGREDIKNGKGIKIAVDDLWK